MNANQSLRKRNPRVDPSEVRQFFCRNCGQKKESSGVPRGWYTAARHPGEKYPMHRLGCFCCATCLAKYTIREIIKAEEDLGGDWDTVASPYKPGGQPLPSYAGRTNIPD